MFDFNRYLVETPKHLPKRSILIKELTMSNVVAWSGDPSDERTISIFAALRPGTYTILCAAYKSGDEGPFTLTIRTNYSVRTNQLWPPLWKKQGKDGPEKTLKDKMLAKGKALADKGMFNTKHACTRSHIQQLTQHPLCLCTSCSRCIHCILCIFCVLCIPSLYSFSLHVFLPCIFSFLLSTCSDQKIFYTL